MTTTTEAMEPGIYDDLPEQVYLDDPALSSSDLKTLTKAPALFKHAEHEETAAMSFGSLTHAVLFGTGREYVVSPFDSFRSKEAREWKAEQEKAGTMIVTADEVTKATEIANAVRNDPDAGPLFTDGRPEVSVWWDHPSGIRLRCRFDYLPDAKPGRRRLLPDLKTTVDASPWEFDSAVGKYGYFQSAAHYTDGAKAVGLDPDPIYVLVAVEKRKPYIVQPYVISDEDLELGRRLNERAIRLYARCMETGEWPKYHTGVKRLSLRPYHAIPAQEILDAD